MPRTIGGNTGLVRSGRITPTVSDRLVLRLRAIEFGVYPISRAASVTRVAVAALTRCRVLSLSARDAVAGWIPTRLATSRRVMGPLPEGRCTARDIASSSYIAVGRDTRRRGCRAPVTPPSNALRGVGSAAVDPPPDRARR